MKFINPYKLFTFSGVPCWLMERTEISAGAKLTYAVLSRRAGEDGLCIPGQKALAKEMGVTDRQIRRYLTELVNQKLLYKKQRGLNKSNSYAFLNHLWITKWFATQDRQDSAGQDRTDVSGQKRTDVSDLKDPVKRSSSSSEELRSSSSSPDEEEDRNLFRDKLTDWYRTVSQEHHGLRSPLKAPAKYFSKVSQNGDNPSKFSISAATLTCLRIWEAFTLDWAEGKPHRKDVYTVPMPGELRGLVEVGEAIVKWVPSRAMVRNVSFNFVRYDDESLVPEIEPEHLLGRIARHPEKFVTALENLTREP